MDQIILTFTSMTARTKPWTGIGVRGVATG
jgi:hypothetical protein